MSKQFHSLGNYKSFVEHHPCRIKRDNMACIVYDVCASCKSENRNFYAVLKVSPYMKSKSSSKGSSYT
jgi:hypothetical protein